MCQPFYRGLRQLNTFGSQQDSYKDKIIDNGLKDIINAIDNHPFNSRVAEYGLGLLWDLCDYSQQCQLKVASDDIDGIKLIFNLINFHVTNSMILVKGFRVIGILSHSEEIAIKFVNKNVLRLIGDAMGRNITSIPILNVGCHVLSNIASHKQCSIKLMKQGVMNVILNCSLMYKKIISLQQTVINCIEN